MSVKQNNNNMLPVGQQVIITKVSQGDYKDGIRADKICVVTSVSKRMYELQPVGNPSKTYILFHDQVRPF